MKKSIQLPLVLALVLMGGTTAVAGKKGHKSSGKTSSKAKITQVIAQVEKYNWEWDENNNTSQKDAWYEGMNKIVFAYYQAKHGKAGDGSLEMFSSVRKDMIDYREEHEDNMFDMRETASLSWIFNEYIEMYLIKKYPKGLSSSLDHALQAECKTWNDFNKVFKTIYLDMCEYEVAGGSLASLYRIWGGVYHYTLRNEDLNKQNKILKSGNVSSSNSNYSPYDFLNDMNDCIALYNKKYPSHEYKDFKNLYDEICEANEKLEGVLLRWYDARQAVIKALSNTMSAEAYENCTQDFMKSLINECEIKECDNDILGGNSNAGKKQKSNHKDKPKSVSVDDL